MKHHSNSASKALGALFKNRNGWPAKGTALSLLQRATGHLSHNQGLGSFLLSDVIKTIGYCLADEKIYPY
jgi:hypothetical protein